MKTVWNRLIADSRTNLKAEAELKKIAKSIMKLEDKYGLTWANVFSSVKEDYIVVNVTAEERDTKTVECYSVIRK